MEGLGFDDATKVCLYTCACRWPTISISQKEIQTALVQGQRQAQAHSQLLAFTSMCWDKCVTGTPGSRFARSEETCIVNCIDRFVDASEYLVGQIQRQQQLQQAQKS
ncbi:hypothetical protein HD554DRAFT_2014561 [Boletus coccyginus]|nr:hypothetical protein HD554DRAFT_2014561 [Boletus coccyginus]